MRRRLIAAVFMLFLLLSPAFAGHSVVNGAYCDSCDNITCICDGHGGNQANSNQANPSNAGPEMMLSLFVLLMLLRYRS